VIAPVAVLAALGSLLPEVDNRAFLISQSWHRQTCGWFAESVNGLRRIVTAGNSAKCGSRQYLHDLPVTPNLLTRFSMILRAFSIRPARFRPSSW
jgi:hypothetical protein